MLVQCKKDVCLYFVLYSPVSVTCKVRCTESGFNTCDKYSALKLCFDMLRGVCISQCRLICMKKYKVYVYNYRYIV